MDKLADNALHESQLINLGDPESIKQALVNYLIHVVGRDPNFANKHDWFYALAYLVRGALSERYIRTARTQTEKDVKRVYYLSMEYLLGRSLSKQLLDLGMMDKARAAVAALAKDYDGVGTYDEIEACEYDAALGNGGLGRLAACFLDSLATHSYPGFGYGIRYEFGMFNQRIQDGQQVENPENWLRHGHPWEFERPDISYKIPYYGRIITYRNHANEEVTQWVETQDVTAIAYDVPVSGFGVGTVSNLRLWGAFAEQEFNLQYFNEGNYVDAVRNKTESETLSKVLYPNDQTMWGQELRLKQEFFFCSSSIQDILKRYLRTHDTLDDLPTKVAIQLNDTHPALAVPELMRQLMDDHGYGFFPALEIVQKVFNYTNHTLLPEALETWGIDMLGHVLPRHLDLIYKINHEFLKHVRHAFPEDRWIQRHVSLVDDDRRCIRMSHLAIVCSGKVNGVAELHTKLLRQTLFEDFDRLSPEKFINMTNGITPRRWLLQANPELSALITETIGDGWIRDLSELRKLEKVAKDAKFRKRYVAAKLAAKEKLARLIEERTRIKVDPNSMFDTQVKRIHEYKRQLLNMLHVVTRYNRIRDNRDVDVLPRTVIIGGKAAPGYYMAKLIIRLVNDIGETVNNDPAVGDKLRVVFMPNYNVSSAQVIMPGSDLSEQISTAGTEASGTGNMKFALNGALTIGTLDGANIEILEEVGADNIFIFGLNAEEAEGLRAKGYNPWDYYNNDEELRRALDMIGSGFFSPDDPDRYRPIVDALLRHGDHFLLLADYRAYIQCQEAVDAAYRDQKGWVEKSILNIANMGKFSSDRTIHAYAKEIWGIEPMPL